MLWVRPRTRTRKSEVAQLNDSSLRRREGKVPTPKQLTGSEYGGVQPTKSTIQPKGADALSNGDRLRLGYLTGQEDNPESLEDRRQFLGLRPASGRRPLFLLETGMESELERRSDIEIDIE